MPPGSHLRYRSRRSSFWARFGAQGLEFQLNVIGSVISLAQIALSPFYHFSITLPMSRNNKS